MQTDLYMEFSFFFCPLSDSVYILRETGLQIRERKILIVNGSLEAA